MLSRLWHMLRSHLDSASEWHAAYMREHDEHLATQAQLDDALALLSDTQDRAALAAASAAEWQARAEHAEALLHGRADVGSTMAKPWVLAPGACPTCDLPMSMHEQPWIANNCPDPKRRLPGYDANGSEVP